MKKNNHVMQTTEIKVDPKVTEAWLILMETQAFKGEILSCLTKGMVVEIDRKIMGTINEPNSS